MRSGDSAAHRHRCSFPGRIGISSRLSLKLCLGVINFQAGINAAPGEVSLSSSEFPLCLQHPQFLGNGFQWDLSLLAVKPRVRSWARGPAKDIPWGCHDWEVGTGWSFWRAP